MNPKPTLRLSPLTATWLRGLVIPIAITLVGLVGLSVLVLAVQAVLRAPFVPGPLGLLRLLGGFVPEVAGIMVPVALLFATTVLARRWSETGAFLAVHTAGSGARRLLPGVLISGVVLGTLVMFLTHVAGPWGRAQVRSTVVDAAHDFELQARRPLALGDWWLRVGATEGSRISDVLLLRPDGAVWAPSGTAVAGVITLHNGYARALEGGDAPLWELRFDQIELRPGEVNIPTHPLEYGFDQLQSLIERRAARGRPVHSETLWLYKRSTLPLSVPLLALAGLPMGARFRRPWVPCLGVVLLLWASQRAGDHLAESLGAGLAASLPLGVLLGIVIVVWIGWRDR